MPGQERRAERAHRFARRALISVGEDIHETRLRAGMTLRELSAASNVSPAELSRIERALSNHVAYETLALIGAAVGLDISIRAFPNGQAVRDAAQLELLRRLRGVLAAGLRLRFEVPIGVQNDLRAWDATIEASDWWLPVEAETRLRDVQALLRRIQLKCRDAGAARVVLLIADTRHNRHVIRLAADAFAEVLPLSSRVVRSAFEAGREPTGSGILLL